jgi:type IV secretory pathway VirB4 component
MAGQATQDFVPIEKIRDGIITLKNGELRAVLMTSSINLALKSAEEQQAVILQFQNLLNSIEFPIQIFIQSRRLNIKPYLTLLQERGTQVKEELLKVQIREYIQFIDRFTSETNIMTKHFFIVIPYYPTVLSGGTQDISSLLSLGGQKKVDPSQDNRFEQGRIQLEQRIGTVTQGLARFGVRAVKLSTEEVVELFYKLFNPGEEDHPIIPKSDDVK